MEAAFEALYPTAQKREQGVVYTPPHITDYLVREGMKMGGRLFGKTTRICDPCCGGAAFILAAARYLEKQHGVPPESALQEHIWGFDCDEAALENTQVLAELFLAQRGRPLHGVRLNLHRCDVFTLDVEKFLPEVGVPDGFDLVATNPPYVKLQNLPDAYRSELIERYTGLASGSFSLAMLFLIAAQELLSSKGCLAVITQNNLFTSLAAEEVRRRLQTKRSIRRVVDFGHQKVFPNASAYTCLIFITDTPKSDIEYDVIREPVTQRTLDGMTFSSVPYEGLEPGKWRLAKTRDLDCLRRIEQAGTPLGELAPIRVGFATLKDRVFLVEKHRDVILARSLSGALVEIESEITKPAVKIADMDSESSFDGNRLHIICPYERRGGRSRLFTEDEMRKRFPLALAYLRECQPLLASRDKGNKTYDGWYAWGRTQGMEATGPKLLTKTFSKGPNFMLDPSDQLFCNGYAVFPPSATLFGPALPIEALQRILNSVVMFFFARMTSFQIEGGYECYQKNFIERFGIPRLETHESSALARMAQSEADYWLCKRYGLDADYLNEALAISPFGPEDAVADELPVDRAQSFGVTV